MKPTTDGFDLSIESHDIPPGRIDIHSHILPGIDDGCATVEESLQSIYRLKTLGYVGTICTPHCWPVQYPHINPDHIKAWRDALAEEVQNAGLEYRLWTGGELRLYPEVIQWMQANGVPTLADSRYVLCDFWEPRWEDWIEEAFDWLTAEGYTPILAHPERSPTRDDYEAHLDRVASDGVVLQGNLRCFTGEEGHYPDQAVRRYMDEGRYTLLALDMHRPATLQGRLDGISIAGEEYGAGKIESMIDREVRRLIFAS
ncbi:MAG: CpsB/CapC family capsule biosynthesis tyrosine phosphatase [Planctomycetota bacterium]